MTDVAEQCAGVEMSERSSRGSGDRARISVPWVPPAVRTRLASLQKKRKDKEQKQAHVSLSKLLSLKHIEHSLQDTASRSSSRTQLQRPPSLARFVSGGKAIDPLNEDHRLSTPSLFVAPEVNQQIRTQLLHQHWLTNRFTGSSQAEDAEAAFLSFISRYHLRGVRFRLLLTGTGLLLRAIEPLANVEEHPEGGPLAAFLILGTFAPSFILLGASALCFARRTRPWWRIYVITALVSGYNAILWAEAIDPTTKDLSDGSSSEASSASKIFTLTLHDYASMLRLVWLLVTMQISSLIFALDFLGSVTVMLCQWLSFAVASIYFFSLSRSTEPSTATQINIPTSIRTLIESLLTSLLATALLSFAVHSLWREKRTSFVNSYVLVNRALTEERRKQGTDRPILALFSNPSAPLALQLRPLALGQELKYLMRNSESASGLSNPRMSITCCA